jgi:hypothetical protein
MGVVYRAFDQQLRREVALKVPGGDRLTGDRLARFMGEGRTTAALRHVGIVGVHDMGHVDGRPYLAYELVEGARALDVAWQGLPADHRARLVRDAARALGHAHTAGVVHRDVKPENLLVDAQGRVRVADFGLALVQGQDRLTRTGQTVGTLFYAPFEQLTGERGLMGPAADVFALGVVLYQGLTGRLPFPGPSWNELLGQLSEGAPERPQGPGVTPALADVCLWALRAEPGQRPADGEAFAQAIEAALAGELTAPRASGGAATQRWRIAGGVLALAAVLLPALWVPAEPAPASATPRPVEKLPLESTPTPRERAAALERGRWELRHGTANVAMGWGAGRLYAIGAEGRLLGWDIEPGEPREAGRWRVRGYPSGRPLVASRWGVLCCFGDLHWLASGQQAPLRLSLAGKVATAAALSSAEFLVGLEDGRVLRVQSAGAEPELLGRLPGRVQILLVPRPGRVLLVVNDLASREAQRDGLYGWDLARGDPELAFREATGQASSLAACSDGRVFVGTTSNSVLVWDDARRQVGAPLRGEGTDNGVLPVQLSHLTMVRAVAITADERHLISVGSRLKPPNDDYIDGELRVWDLHAEPVRQLGAAVLEPAFGYQDVGISHDGRWVALACSDGRVEVMAVQTLLERVTR